MPATYAIADLHGRFDLLEMAIDAIEKNAWKREVAPKIVCLGDYIDRGPQSRQIIERLILEQRDSAGTFICLKGNHEDIMWQTIRKPLNYGWWLSNGGGYTLMSYGQKDGEAADGSVVPAEHLDWIEHLPLMHVDKHRVFVHAGVDPSCPLDRQIQQIATWKIYDDWDESGHGQRHIVHGHHQNAHGPIKKKNRTDLDTFAWYTGRLVVGVFDDEVPGGPIEEIEIIGEPIEARRYATLTDENNR